MRGLMRGGGGAHTVGGALLTRREVGGAGLHRRRHREQQRTPDGESRRLLRATVPAAPSGGAPSGAPSAAGPSRGGADGASAGAVVLMRGALCGWGSGGSRRGRDLVRQGRRAGQSEEANARRARVKAGHAPGMGGASSS